MADRVRIWCEDRAHEAFARRLLQHLGIERRKIEVRVAPRGMGSAAAWVIKRYPDVRTRARATRHQIHPGFLVVIDGDRFGVQARIRQLHGTGDDREDGERVAIWVPTWSIETWVVWLRGDDADEHVSYQEHREDFLESMNRAVGSWKPKRADEDARVPSLAAARREIEQRLSLG